MSDNAILPIPKYRLSTFEITEDRPAAKSDDCVRVYRSSPTAVTLQIRHDGPVGTCANPSGSGKKTRRMVSSVTLSAGQVADIVAALARAGVGLSTDGANTQALIGRALGGGEYPL